MTSGSSPVRSICTWLYARRGATSIYVEFPDTEHGFDLACPMTSPVAQSATYDTERFLALML